MEKTVYLIRHAQSHPSRNVPTAQWPLSTLGRDQAHALAPLLSSLSIERLYSSPYLRCLQTIEPFANASGLAIEKRASLHERDVAKSLSDDFKQIWQQSWEDFDLSMPECESNRQARDRFVQGVSEIVNQSEESVIGICSHGTVIGLFLHALVGGDGRKLAERLTNPDVIRIQVVEDSWIWDQCFRLEGLSSAVSHPDETPID